MEMLSSPRIQHPLWLRKAELVPVTTSMNERLRDKLTLTAQPDWLDVKGDDSCLRHLALFKICFDAN